MTDLQKVATGAFVAICRNFNSPVFRRNVAYNSDSEQKQVTLEYLLTLKLGYLFVGEACPLMQGCME